MATAPYRINDRRSVTGYVNSNRLIEAATQTIDRKRVPMLDGDVHRNITSYGRRMLTTLGRHMFWNLPALQGMILEQANLAVSSFIPQFAGADKEWGEEAEALLTDWHKVMDVAGWPYDYDSFLQGKVIDPIVDGENYTLLTQSPEGYPLVQVIQSHRVGCTQNHNETATVKFSGNQMFIDGVLVDENRPYSTESDISFQAQIIDGVIVDAYNRAIAYRLTSTDESGKESYRDISARNMFPAFCPLVPGQVRGFSLLASSVFDWQDLKEWARFEMLAQKAFSTRTIVETNETGDVDTVSSIIAQNATADSSGNKTGLDVQKLEGGTIHYLKAGTGSKLEAFNYDRPGAASQNFMNTALRDAFRGTEWDVFFSLDPQKVGGAPMRVIVEKINAVLGKRRKLVRKCCARVDGYALSRFIKLKLLRPNDEWYKWEYQGPGDVTADKKYDSEVDLSEIYQGIGTKKKAIARRGDDYGEVRKQRKSEADDELADAQELASKYKITIQEALVILRPPTPGAQMPQQQPANNSTSEEQ